MHVVLAGGGTAGHVEPALAVAEALRRRDPEIGITMLGTARGIETRLVPARGFDLALIPPVPLPRAWVCTAQAAGVASKTSAVVTIPSDLPWVRARYSPMYSMRGLSKASSVSSGKTPSWLLLFLLPVE